MEGIINLNENKCDTGDVINENLINNETNTEDNKGAKKIKFTNENNNINKNNKKDSEEERSGSSDHIVNPYRKENTATTDVSTEGINIHNDITAGSSLQTAMEKGKNLPEKDHGVNNRKDNECTVHIEFPLDKKINKYVNMREDFSNIVEEIGKNGGKFINTTNREEQALSKKVDKPKDEGMFRQYCRETYTQGKGNFMACIFNI